jgi:hypothetical protein
LFVDARIGSALLLRLPTTMARTPITSPAAWRAVDVTDPSDWTFTLDDTERDEIVEATKHAIASGLTTESVTREAFALPRLSAEIAKWARELDQGRGFILLRRFPQDELTPAETELAYVGLGTHLGSPVSQDAHGSLLGHVRDEGIARETPAVRFYRTRERQDFHTDGADLVGLLCLQRAKRGGESKIASSYAVYNEMLRRRPDLVEILYEPLYWDRNDEQSEGEPPAYPLPVFTDVEGKPRIFYIGWYIRDAQRHPDVPRLTQSQRDAMDLLEAIANDVRVHITMDFQPGDVQLLNNAKILHAREGYTDEGPPGARRHLLRLWLAAHDFSSVEGALKSGIPRREASSDALS